MWLVEKHGAKTRRSWCKLHIGLDADTGQLVAAALIAREVDDGAAVGPLLDQVAASVASFTADGAYDQDSVSAAVAERHPAATIIVPPRSTAVPSATAETEPTQRDRQLQFIAKHGRAAWQKASGYIVRARAEATIGRFKQVVGDGLRSRTDERRATEADVAVNAQPHAGAGTPHLRPHCLNVGGAGVTAAASLVHATRLRNGHESALDRTLHQRGQTRGAPASRVPQGCPAFGR